MQRRFALAGALLLLIAALPQSLAWTQEYISGQPSSSDRGFASTPALWNAVRRHTGPTERVANNPMFMANMTPWSINISWALLADRRSCFAGSDYLTPFTTLTQAQQIETAEFFQRIFAGEASDSDLQVLTHRYRCDVVVLTPHDGAWERDPFIASTAFAQVEKADDWRIYRATAGAK